MRFVPIQIPGAFIIEIEPHADARGLFARTFCQAEFEAQGLASSLVQCSLSFNIHAHTLRGMHLQMAPHEEVKVVRCTRGSIFDVIVDVRPDSPTHTQWVGVELSAENHRMLYIPGGVAHGFLTLESNAEVFYQMAESFHPESAQGYRWDDPAFGIDWPHDPAVISEKDRSHADYAANA